ncbi:MAG: sulfatase [Candidatus Hydrogenedentales bacterium]|jgi:arylsulfatase A-like enzyme
MKRRDFLMAAAAGSLLTACAGQTPPLASTKKQKKQNFLFILVDDLGWRDLGCFGSPLYETPHIDRLASQGMRFTDAYAAAPVCSPTRVSIMTGKYPARLSTTHWFGAPQPEQVLQSEEWEHPMLPASYTDQLSRNEVTIAEALKGAGYRSFYAGKWHLGGKQHYPENQGFDANKGGWEKGHPSSYFSPYQNPKLKDGEDGEHLPERLARESVQFLEKNSKHPFLLFLSFYSVHLPLQGREDLIKKYEAKLADINFDEPDYSGEGAERTKRRQDNAVYAAMVEAMDEAVGRVLNTLDRLQLSDNTTICFISDNGGVSSSQHGVTTNAPLRAGKGWLYEGGIRVPMIVKAPGITAAGSTCSHPVLSTDFYPTMLELAGLPLDPEQHADAVSFLPLLLGESLPKDRPLFWHFPHYTAQGSFPGGAVRLGSYKLIQSFEDQHFELYNLRDDLEEQVDLIHEAPNYAEPMKEMLKKWQKDMNARFPSPLSKAALK